MVIKSPSFEYSVVKKAVSNNSYDVFICKEKSSGSSGFFTINKLKEPLLIEKLLPYFNIIMSQDAEKGLKDLFVIDSDLYAVFEYQMENQILISSYNYCAKIDKKLDLIKKTLQLVESEPLPTAIMKYVFHRTNLNIDSKENLYLNYIFQMTDINDNDRFYFLSEFNYIIDDLLLYEDKTPVIEDFINKCHNHGYTSISEISDDIDKCKKSLCENNKTNSVSRILKPVFMFVLFASTFILMVSIFTKAIPGIHENVVSVFKTFSQDSDNSYTGMDQIGTLKLSNDTME